MDAGNSPCELDYERKPFRLSPVQRNALVFTRDRADGPFPLSYSIKRLFLGRLPSILVGCGGGCLMYWGLDSRIAGVFFVGLVIGCIAADIGRLIHTAHLWPVNALIIDRQRLEELLSRCCPQCGNDLRGSTERCPSCSAAVPASPSSTAQPTEARR